MKTNFLINNEVKNESVFKPNLKNFASKSSKNTFSENSEITPFDFKSLLNQENNDFNPESNSEDSVISFEEFFNTELPFLPNLINISQSKIDNVDKISSENSEIFRAIFSLNGALGVDLSGLNPEKLAETIRQQSNIALTKNSELDLDAKLTPEIKNLLKSLQSETKSNQKTDINANNIIFGENQDLDEITYKIHKNLDMLGSKKLTDIDTLKINKDTIQISAKVAAEPELDTNVKILKNTIHQEAKEGGLNLQTAVFGEQTEMNEENLGNGSKSFLEKAIEKNLEKTLTQVNSQVSKSENFVSGLNQIAKGEAGLEENPQLVRIKEFADKAIKLANKTQTGTTSAARLLLRPESLGTVLVQVTVGDQAAKLKIETNTKEAAAKLEGQIAVLRDKFSQNGLKMESCDINFRQSEEAMPDYSQSDRNSQKSDRKIMQDFLKTLRSLSGLRDETDMDTINT
jgi:flagellar hook-length control protein FliK